MEFANNMKSGRTVKKHSSAAMAKITSTSCKAASVKHSSDRFVILSIRAQDTSF